MEQSQFAGLNYLLQLETDSVHIQGPSKETLLEELSSSPAGISEDHSHGILGPSLQKTKTLQCKSGLARRK